METPSSSSSDDDDEEGELIEMPQVQLAKDDGELDLM